MSGYIRNIYYAGNTVTSCQVMIKFEDCTPDDRRSRIGSECRRFLKANGFLPQQEYIPGDESDDQRRLWTIDTSSGVQYRYSAGSADEAERAAAVLCSKFNVPFSFPL